MRSFLILLLIAGCRTEPLPDRPRDASTADLSRKLVDIHCGQDTCRSSGACCSPSFGASGSCILPANCPAPNRFLCDDPADCAAGQSCCHTSDTGSICIDTVVCKMTDGTQRLCGAKSDCDSAENCCPRGGGPNIGTYSVCTSGPCPL